MESYTWPFPCPCPTNSCGQTSHASARALFNSQPRGVACAIPPITLQLQREAVPPQGSLEQFKKKMHTHFLLTKKHYARGNISNQKVLEQIKLDENEDRREEYTTLLQRAHSSTGTSRNNKKYIQAHSPYSIRNTIKNQQVHKSSWMMDNEEEISARRVMGVNH